MIVALPCHTHLLLILETNMLFSIFREDLVVLGTLKQKGRGDTEILLSETEDILSRCKRLVPSLKVPVPLQFKRFLCYGAERHNK